MPSNLSAHGCSFICCPYPTELEKFSVSICSTNYIGILATAAPASVPGRRRRLVQVVSDIAFYRNREAFRKKAQWERCQVLRLMQTTSNK